MQFLKETKLKIELKFFFHAFKVAATSNNCNSDLYFIAGENLLKDTARKCYFA